MIGKKKLNRLIRRLRGIRTIAKMENARFHNINQGPRATCYVGLEPVNNGNMDAFIKERTALWRHSWIEQSLEEIIAELERELSQL
jgi:hypothetical protein